MIEKNVIQSPYYETLVGTFLELKSVIRTLRFIEDKTTYDQQKRDGLFTLFPRIKKQSSRLTESGLQKGFTVGYLYGNNRLSKQQQRLSSKSCPTRSIIYAKDTEPNSESHKELKPCFSRGNKGRIETTVRRNFNCYEINKSRALCNNEKAIKELNLISLKVNSKTLLLIFCFNGFRMIKILSLDLNFMRVKELKFNSFESIKKPYAIFSHNSFTHFSNRP